MGRAALLTLLSAGRLLVAATLLVGVARLTPADSRSEPPRRRFETRVIKVGGPLDRPAVAQHVRFSTSNGFNAIWVPASLAARWTEAKAPEEVALRPEFVRFADEWSKRGARVILVIQPWNDGGDSFTYTDKGKLERLGRLIRRARRDAGVRDFVISFFGAPLRLTELADLTEYGPYSAPAQVALARRLAGRLGKHDRLWLEPSVTSDRYLADPQFPYGGALTEALETLDRRFGIVWSGPEPVSPSITLEDVETACRRFGERPVMLDDRYPANGSGARIPLALVLGPLRHRDPAIADLIDTYVSTPMTELGASRLALLTIGEFLTDPDGYDADVSWRRAKKRLAGEDARAFEALRTQAAEWGGWIGTRNYHTAADDNPATAAATLIDPAAFAGWIWPVRTYPDRMARLSGLADAPFREELLLTMARRLAVARAAPVAKKLLDPSTPRDVVPDLRRQIVAQRAGLSDRPGVRLALDRFLFHAGLTSLLTEPDRPPVEDLP